MHLDDDNQMHLDDDEQLQPKSLKRVFICILQHWRWSTSPSFLIFYFWFIKASRRSSRTIKLLPKVQRWLFLVMGRVDGEWEQKVKIKDWFEEANQMDWRTSPEIHELCGSAWWHSKSHTKATPSFDENWRIDSHPYKKPLAEIPHFSAYSRFFKRKIREKNWQGTDAG